MMKQSWNGMNKPSMIALLPVKYSKPGYTYPAYFLCSFLYFDGDVPISFVNSLEK